MWQIFKILHENELTAKYLKKQVVPGNAINACVILKRRVRFLNSLD